MLYTAGLFLNLESRKILVTKTQKSLLLTSTYVPPILGYFYYPLFKNNLFVLG